MQALSNFSPVAGPSVWRADSFRSPQDFTLRLSPAVIERIRAAAQGCADAGVPTQQIREAPVESDALRECTEAILRELRDGRGFVVVEGLGAEWPEPVLERAYWILGLALGVPLSQSPKGDMLGRVEDTSTGSTARGYKTRRILPLHTDTGDIMGLLCVRNAKAGGTTVIASIAAAYNDIGAAQPELVPLLERGFFHHRRGEQAADQPAVTPYRMPVAAVVDGRIMSHYGRSAIDLAGQELGVPFTEEEVRALELFDAVTGSSRNRVEFDLQPGQVLYMNNYNGLHARTEFVDWEQPAQRRLLMRGWWDVGWPVPRQFRPYENLGGRGGVDPVDGLTIQPVKYLKTYSNLQYDRKPAP